MGDYDVFAKRCPSRTMFGDVTGRWGALILGALSTTPMRFGDARRAVDGISDRMLVQNLRTLERDGLVTRKAWNTNPPYTEYALTPLGQEIAVQVRALAQAVEANMDAVLQARSAYDVARPS